MYLSVPAFVAAMAVGALALSLLGWRVRRVLAEQRRLLHASQERLRLLFDRNLAGVYQVALDGTLLDCNEAFAHLLGYSSREECLKASIVDHYERPADRDRFLEQLRARRTLPDFENKLRRRDGQPVWVLETATLLDGPDETNATIEGTVVDISRRKAAEDQLSSVATHLMASVERYRMLVESTDAVPWEIDGLTLAPRYVSPQVRRLFGYDVNDVLNGDAFWAVVHPEDRAQLQARFRDLAGSESQESLDVGYRLVTASGGVAHVRSVVTARRSVDDPHPIVRGITFDVTKQHHLEAELQHSQKLEAVGRLAAGVAHEINTPVQFVGDSLHFVRDGSQALMELVARYRSTVRSLGGTVEPTLLQGLEKAEEDADLDYVVEHLPKALDRAHEGLNRVATIVQSMKEFAHPDNTEMAPVDLNRAIQSTLIVARNEYKYVADVDLELRPIPQVTCFGGDVNQALLNIIVNAAHAIEERVRSTQDRGRISVSTGVDGDAVVVSIADTGGGIPESIRSRVFDPFFTTKEVGRGTGQGLAIARSVVVDKHGGQLTFQTELGVGTTFHLRLPIAGRGPRGVAA